MKRNYLGLSTEKDHGYTYVVVASAALWGGLFYGYGISLTILTAVWKESLDLPFSTASVHHTVYICTSYGVAAATALFINDVSVEFLTSCSILLLMGSYIVVYLFNFFFPKDYFIIAQIIFGAFFGISTGIGSATVNIIPQQWMDKKRGELNPYLLVGSPLVAAVTAPFFKWMCDLYTWSGACLVSIAICAHGVICIILFARYPEHNEITEKIEKKETRNISSYIFDPRLRGCKVVNCLLLYNVIYSSLIFTPVFTFLTNVVTEYGMTSNEVALLWSTTTVIEVFARPLFAMLTKKYHITKLCILWTMSSIVSTYIFAITKSPTMFSVGIMLFGFAIAGANGLKYVLVIEMLGPELQRPFMVLEQLLIFPASIFLPPIGLLLADHFKNPSITFYLPALAITVNFGLALWFHFYGYKMRNTKEQK